MRVQQGQVLLGARVPVQLKEILSKYCLVYGVKMNHFVTEAIREKLADIALDRQDLKIAIERLKKAEFISQDEFDRYLSKRGIRI